MPALARGDAERLIRFVGEAESLGGEDHPVSGDLLFELGRIVAAEWVTYYEHDCVPSQHFVYVQRTGDSEAPYIGESCVLDLNESPIRLRRRQREFGALRISDFLTRRELHRTRLYDVTLRPLGTEEVLEVDIPSPPSHWKTFVFERSERAFTERDRSVLDLLQPHLGRLWQAARTRRQLAAARAGLDEAEAGESRGVVLLGARDEFEYASAPARRLLPELTADGSLVEWLESGCPRPLVHRAGAAG